MVKKKQTKKTTHEAVSVHRTVFARVVELLIAYVCFFDQNCGEGVAGIAGCSCAGPVRALSGLLLGLSDLRLDRDNKAAAAAA